MPLLFLYSTQIQPEITIEFICSRLYLLILIEISFIGQIKIYIIQTTSVGNHSFVSKPKVVNKRILFDCATFISIVDIFLSVVV